MAYDRQKIFEQAKTAIKENKLFFVEDVVAFLPISKPTFYDYFKVDSNEFNELKELLEENKIKIKSSMRSKWYKSQNATLQMALMKLICTDEERKKLAINYNETDVTSKGNELKSTPSIISFVDKTESTNE